MKNIFKSENGKTEVSTLRLKTPQQIYEVGHTPPGRMTPSPELIAKEVVQRNWLMSRPIGRFFVYLFGICVFFLVLAMMS